ncbi:MAG: DUF4190 domain-containing protein, partial [Phycisphaerae bacterium]|nr:DUF4190 domain-containing protein [Phycisphaerae bacterium]
MQYTCPHCSREFDVAEGSPAPTQCPLCARPVQIQSPPPVEPVPGGPAQTCGLATASLILSIVGYCVPVLIPDILAIIFGVKARRAIAKSAGRLKGAGMALAGMILGIVNLALMPI